jgi:hypothetical protein
METNKENQNNKVLDNLLQKVAVLNKKTQLIDNYVFENKLSEAQDEVKEALSATLG